MRFAGRDLLNPCLLGVVVSSLVSFGGFTGPAMASTPDSPEVRAMVRRAVRYLSEDHIYDEPHRALAAMAAFKAGEPVTHPLIAKSIEECLDFCRTPETVDAALRNVYGVAVVGLFLCEVDPQRFENEIAHIVQSLERRQKPFGGWGYPRPEPNWEFGDTSMTQYAVLCAWMVRSVGAAEIPQTAIRNVTNWLIRTQDPSGAWGYQGRDPGSYSRRIPQEEVRHSLCAAGLGSLYICSSMLGFTSDVGVVVSDDDLPPALKPVSKPVQRTPDGSVDESLLKARDP